MAIGIGSLFGLNVTFTGGIAHIRSYIGELMPAIVEGTVNPRKGLSTAP